MAIYLLEQKTNGAGDCFKVAYQNMMKYGWDIGHAVVTRPTDGLQHVHAFNIVNEYIVIDFSNGRQNGCEKKEYFRLGKIKIFRIYNKRQALEKAVETEHYGPWDPVFDNY